MRSTGCCHLAPRRHLLVGVTWAAFSALRCIPAIATVPAASTTATTIRFVRRHGFSMAVAALLAQRSGPVVENLVAGLDDLVVGFKNNNNTARRRKKKKRRKKRQVMNASFDRWRLVNTYGAFGFVGQMRDEMVIKGTRGNWDAPDEDWKEYDFAVKPGGKRGTMHGSGARKRSSLSIYLFLSHSLSSHLVRVSLGLVPAVGRRLPTIVPYHHRLDWCVWIATLRPPDDPSNFWLKPLLLKLLRNDEAVSRLLEGEGRGNPFLADGTRSGRALALRETKEGAPVWERTPRATSSNAISANALASELQCYSNGQWDHMAECASEGGCASIHSYLLMLMLMMLLECNSVNASFRFPLGR